MKVGLRECDSMISTGKFKTLEGGRHPVKLNQETVFHINEKGVIHTTANSISCEGQEMRIGDDIVQNMMEFSQYRIILQEESFIIQDS